MSGIQVNEQTKGTEKNGAGHIFDVSGFGNCGVQIQKLFNDASDIQESWKNMPEFNMKNENSLTKITVHFRNEDDVKAFSNLINQQVNLKTKSVWFPEMPKRRYADKRYVSEYYTKSQFPIYIISKGRYETRKTAKSLEKMKQPYYIVVEEFEYDKYKVVTDERYGTVLILPQKYLDEYDTFWERGEDNKTGPGAARNFCWDHSIQDGFKWHWVMDDNIEAFGRINKNLYVISETSAIFKAAEDFVLRYDNIAQSGFNYDFFAKTRDELPPYVLNTRIYSCLLIRNDIPFRWRGRYNEDTDLSLRCLKAGWCTVQFNAFIQQKATTQTVKGGNTDEFYSKEGTMPKSKILEDMHPDCARVVWKFNRWHHEVNYKVFKNELKLKENIEIPDIVNEYGMLLKKVK
jgi:hypothetical protein